MRSTHPPFRSGRPGLLVLLALVASPLAAAPEPPAETDGFVVRLGRDTIAVERFTRTPRRLESDLVFRALGTHWTFTLDLADDGRAVRLENEFRQAADPPGKPPQQSATMTYRGDTAVVDVRPGGVQMLFSKEGAIPFINPSFAMMEVIVHRALARGADHADVPVFAMVGGVTRDVAVRRLGRDSVFVNAGGVEMRFAVDASLRLLGGGVPSQGVSVQRSSVAPSDLAAVVPDYSAPAGAPYSAEAVSVPTAGGFSLAGTFTRPRGVVARVPAVVTISGSGLEDRDEAIPGVPGYRPFRQIADTLSRRGIAVLRLDDRGFGGSGGNPTRSTTEDFANDVRAALSWLRARTDVDARRIALLGHSEGGIIAPLVAASDPGVRALVLLAAPAWTGRRVIESQNLDLIERAGMSARGRDSTLAAAMHAVDSLGTVQPWLGFFLKHDPLPVARRVRVPVLLLQGETDRQVTAGQVDELAAAFRAGGNRDVTARRLPMTNHLFLADRSGDPAGYARLPERQIGPGILGTIADWLTAKLH